MAEKQAEAEAPKKGGGMKKLILILLAVVLLLVVVGGGAAVYLLTSKPAAEKEAADEEEDVAHRGPPIYERLDTFTVNLSGQRTAYLRAEIQMQVSDAKVQNELKARMPEVRNEVIRILSSRTPEELATLEGKDAVAADIQAKANEVLGAKKNKGVLRVLFNDFIIQQ